MSLGSYRTNTETGDAKPRGPLLMTKLLLPQARYDLVRRERLFSQLDRGVARKLTVVLAPPGFGKTTLLSTWANVHLGGSIPVAWVSLDEEDNDPVRFWSYLIKSVGDKLEQVDDDVLNLLGQDTPPSTEAIITTFINAIALGGQEFVLMLDDYNAISASVIHEGVSFMLEHMPPTMHLMIASRKEPPLPLARLRGTGQLVEIDTSSLRFTLEEARDFLSQIMGLDISSADAAALENRTEGWVAGLQMAAISIQNQQDISAFIQNFTGDDRNIQDYLIEEVLRTQPDDVRTFLVETSILERVNGDLCDAVTGRDDSQALLESFEKANLFIISLDNRRLWYRYHRLFLDMLRSRLEQLDTERVKKLHLRAAEWFEQNGLSDEALAHAMSAQDYQRLISLLDRAGMPLLMHGEVNLILECLEALPKDMLRARPRLALFYALALLRGDQTHAVEPILAEAEASLGENAETEEDGARNIRGALAAIRAALAVNLGEVGRSFELSRQALEYLSQDNLLLRALVARNLGDAHASKDDLDLAIGSTLDGIAMSQQTGDLFETVLGTSSLGRLYELQGRLRQAASVYREALELADREDGVSTYATALAHMGLGWILGERNRPGKGLEHTEKAIELLEKWGNIRLLVEGYIILGRIKYIMGDKRGAFQTISRSRQLARKHNFPSAYPQISGMQARFLVYEGRLPAATAWARSSGLSVDDDLTRWPFRLLRLQHVTLARVLIALGRCEKALGLLGRLLDMAEVSGRMAGVIEVLVYTSLAYNCLGRREEAAKHFNRALELAAPEGFVRTIADEGENAAQLLGITLEYRAKKAENRAVKLPDDFLRELFGILEINQDKGPAMARQPLLDPLSEREIEVLKLLGDGLSNKDIGERLYVAVNTVKTHIRNIYSKLDVNSRTQAVNRAKELGFIR